MTQLGQHKNLTEFEASEINDYSIEGVYFTGRNIALKISYSFHSGEIDATRFDDEKGYYKIVPNDHIRYRYEIIRTLGKGAYSEVVESYDHKTKTPVAIKIIRKREVTTKYKHLSEIQMLQFLNEQFKNKHLPFVRMLEHFVFRGHSCIVFELLYSDLLREIVKTNFKGFNLHTTTNIIKSLLKGLYALKTLKLVHGDVKSANVVLTRKGQFSVRLIDFGNCHFESEQSARYMQSRYYRAPEVLLRLNYDAAIDMWAVGCIAAELFLGKPLFTGKNEADQLAAIIECLGTPPQQLIQASSISHWYFQPNGEPRYCTVLLSNGTTKQYEGQKGGRCAPASKPLPTILKQSKSKPFINFVKRCLTWDPKLRLTPAQALTHYWFPRQPANTPKSPAILNLTKVHSLYEMKHPKSPQNRILVQQQKRNKKAYRKEGLISS